MFISTMRPEEEDAESQIQDGAAVGSHGSQTFWSILPAAILLREGLMLVMIEDTNYESSGVLNPMEVWNPKLPQSSK